MNHLTKLMNRNTDNGELRATGKRLVGAVALLTLPATAAVAGSEVSVVQSNIQAIYQPASSLPTVSTQGATRALALLEDTVPLWLDPSRGSVVGENPAPVMAPVSQDARPRNVAYENIRDIFNVSADD